jgi:hypothetical protein
MGFLIQIVSTYAPWIYALCGLIALLQVYRIWQVRSERRQAIFSLEREKAMRDLYNIFFIATILLAIMGGTYFLSNTLAIAVEAQEGSQQSVELPIDLPQTLPTPSPTPQPPITSTPIEIPEATQTATPAPLEIVEQALPPTPTPEPLSAPICSDPRAALTSPGNGATVTGAFNIQGTAVHEQFQYYKIEYAPGANADGGFVYLAGGNAPVSGGFLASLDSTTLDNGSWTLRLVVVDQTGNFPDPCRVTISVQN